MQEYLNLGDWRGLELPSNDKRRKESVKLFDLSTSVWTDWANLKETLAGLQTAGDEEGQEDNSSTAAKRKRQTDASPMDFHGRTLAGGTVWDSLINLKKIIELLVQRNEANRIQAAQHLCNNFTKLMRSKENDSLTQKHIDPVLLGLIESMQGVWDEERGLRNW